MTMDEFKIWLDGFMDGRAAPSPEQWARIKQKMTEVESPAPDYHPGVMPCDVVFSIPGTPLTIPTWFTTCGSVTCGVQGAQSWNAVQ